MSAYSKKIAVIKQVKSGFSADGGALSGLVKAETYAGFLKVEASLINFAPVAEGRYVLGITDGLTSVIFEGAVFEGESKLNLTDGFAFLVCFCHTTVAPVASASCGQLACALPDLKEEITKRENLKRAKGGVATTSPPAIKNTDAANVPAQKKAGVKKGEKNNERGGNFIHGEPLRKNKKGQKGSDGGGKNEKDTRPVASEKGEEPARSRLAGGDYYCRMRGEIERIFLTYPAEEELERAMEGGRFARIAYGEGRYYVFGVLNIEGVPRYILYAIHAHGKSEPPPSLKDCATYFPTASGGYFITCQDAATGVSVKLNFN